MRYTRYNYKPPRKKNNFMITVILIIIAAIALGTIFSKLLPKNNNGDLTDGTKTDIKKVGEPSKDGKEVSKVVSETNIKDYVAIQCGVFSNKANALVLKNSLMKFGTPFIVEEDNVSRVLFGIYPKESVDSITKELQVNKIGYVKVKFEFIAKDPTSAQTHEMISADIKILNKLSEKDTKAYGTADLKKWLLTLEGAEEKSENYNDMKEIKAYLTALPAEFKREKTEEAYIYIYKFMKKLIKV